MNSKWIEVPGSIVAPKGFKAAGVFCDIKRLGTGKGSEKGKKRDLALIVSEAPPPSPACSPPTRSAPRR